MLRVSNGVARDILKATNGQFFSVTFRARGTGKERTIVGRTGVRKGLNGGELQYDPATLPMLMAESQLDIRQYH